LKSEEFKIDSFKSSQTDDIFSNFLSLTKEYNETSKKTEDDLKQTMDNINKQDEI